MEDDVAGAIVLVLDVAEGVKVVEMTGDFNVAKRMV